jgi:hypothetical protein
MTNCGHCHTCGHRLKIVLDGEEWCPICKTYRRYRSHGWGQECADASEPCPAREEAVPPKDTGTDVRGMGDGQPALRGEEEK